MELDEIVSYSIIMNTIAIIMMIGILIMERRMKAERRTERLLFKGMATNLILMAGLYILMACVLAGKVPGGRIAATVTDSLIGITINVMAADWFFYSFHKMYTSNDLLRRKALQYMIPFFVLSVLNLVNCFFPVLAYYDENMVYQTTFLNLIQALIRYGYLIASAFQIMVYQRHGERRKFFDIWAMLIPTILGILIHELTGYKTFPLGMAIGLMLIFMSMLNEYCFEDYDTGFYNSFYLRAIRDRIEKNDYTLGSVLTFCLASAADAGHFADELHGLLPSGSDVVRKDPNTILVLTGVTDRGSLHVLTEDVEAKGKEMGISVEIKSEVKKKDQEMLSFFDSFASSGPKEEMTKTGH